MRKVDIVRGKLEKLVNLLTQKKIKVTQRGERAYTRYNDKTSKPELINIPQIPDNADDALLSAIEGYVDHEVGHALFSSANALAIAKGDGRLESIMNMVEDAFIERKMMETFEGSSYNLAKTAEFFEKESIDPLLEYADTDVLNRALMIPAIRAWGGCHQFVDYMEDKWDLVPELVSKVADYAKTEIPKIQDSMDSYRVAKGILELLEKEDEGQGQQEGDSEQEESRDGNGEGSPSDTKSEGQNEGRSDEQNPQKDEEGGDDDGQDNPKKVEWFDKADGSDVFSKSLSDAIKAKIESIETDNDYRVYTKEFDKIEPEEAETVSSDSVERFESSVRGILGVVQKKLERIISAKSLGYWVGGHRSGKLNATALSRFVVRDDSRVFKRKHITNTKDTAVTLLIDCSGSMQGSRIRLACQTAYSLISAMERLNIKNEVLGFTTGEFISNMKSIKNDSYDFDSSRERRLIIPIFKSFAERFTFEVKQRLVKYGNSNGHMWDNVDGESVMIAANRLLQRQESRKILIVLSDGQPNSAGDVDFDRHLRETVRYIEEKTPIEIVGIGIESRKVRNYYSNNVVLEEVEQLPTTCLDKLQKILLK